MKEYDANLNIQVGKAADFLGRITRQRELRRERNRNELSKEALDELRELVEQRKSDPKAIAFKKKCEESDRRNERDGVGVSDYYFDGFRARKRIADRGERIVYLGRDPEGDWKSDYVVLTVKKDEPMQSYRFNMRVYECWIAECSDCVVVRVGNDELRELSRGFYVFLDAEGEVVGQVQYPNRSFRFLGISEFGTHYVWTYGEWLHLTDLRSGVDFLTRKIPRDYYPTVADLDTEESKIKLRAYGGMELSLSWEDEPEGDFKGFCDRFNEETRNDYRADMLKDFWESHPEPPRHFAASLVQFLEKIEFNELRDSSLWETVTIPVFWRLCVAIYEGAGDAEMAEMFQQRKDEYENPFNVAQESRSAVLAGIETGDDEVLKNWSEKITKVIETGRLGDHPYYLAPCYRYLGEIFFYFENWESAKSYFEKALEVDENAGCKRKLATTLKKLS